MSHERLIAVFGMGPDAPGLIGRIAGAIAGLGGNIVDLHQNVNHGLFSVFCLVDMTASGLPDGRRLEDLAAAMKTVSQETGLRLHADSIGPSSRSPERRSVLLVLIGPDKPGIVASMAQTLGRYGINIDAIRNVAREGVFLMELLADYSRSSLPEPNLERTLRDVMTEQGILVLFQFRDVFNKKKRVIVFDRRRSLLSEETVAVIVKQTGLDPASLDFRGSRDETAERCASLLEGCSADLLEKIAEGLAPCENTIELIQELKLLGYLVVVASSGFSFLAPRLKKLLGADHVWSVPIEIDPDTRAVAGRPASSEPLAVEQERFLAGLLAAEKVAREDVVVIGDAIELYPRAPGIRLDFDPRFLLDAFNRKALSADALAGVLGSFGDLKSGKA